MHINFKGSLAVISLLDIIYLLNWQSFVLLDLVAEVVKGLSCSKEGPASL